MRPCCPGSGRGAGAASAGLGPGSPGRRENTRAGGCGWRARAGSADAGRSQRTEPEIAVGSVQAATYLGPGAGPARREGRGMGGRGVGGAKSGGSGTAVGARTLLRPSVLRGCLSAVLHFPFPAAPPASPRRVTSRSSSVRLPCEKGHTDFRKEAVLCGPPLLWLPARAPPNSRAGAGVEVPPFLGPPATATFASPRLPWRGGAAPIPAGRRWRGNH